VLDIEEITWAPKYGLKGMIDSSIRVEVESNKNGRTENVMPLEFKSGKALNGQNTIDLCLLPLFDICVVIYRTLCAFDVREVPISHIDMGLLYYLQSDQTQVYPMFVDVSWEFQFEDQT
ncbi:hypothetical protein G4B88_021857, partial [Cannabis sativa]